MESGVRIRLSQAWDSSYMFALLRRYFMACDPSALSPQPSLDDHLMSEDFAREVAAALWPEAFRLQSLGTLSRLIYGVLSAMREQKSEKDLNTTLQNSIPQCEDKLFMVFAIRDPGNVE
jgi:hypothetical protein